MAICNILRRFGIFYDHLVHFVFIWYIFPVLEKSTIGYILWEIGYVFSNVVYFTPLWYIVPRKIWQPCFHATAKFPIAPLKALVVKVETPTLYKSSKRQVLKRHCIIHIE
jgi:hypothetical protein